MAHRNMEAEASHAVPHVSMDYSCLGQEDETTMPVALVRDHASKTTFSHAVLCKGVTDSDYPAKQVAFFHCSAWPSENYNRVGQRARYACTSN